MKGRIQRQWLNPRIPVPKASGSYLRCPLCFNADPFKFLLYRVDIVVDEFDCVGFRDHNGYRYDLPTFQFGRNITQEDSDEPDMMKCQVCRYEFEPNNDHIEVM